MTTEERFYKENTTLNSSVS